MGMHPHEGDDGICQASFLTTSASCAHQVSRACRRGYQASSFSSMSAQVTCGRWNGEPWLQSVTFGRRSLTSTAKYKYQSAGKSYAPAHKLLRKPYAGKQLFSKPACVVFFTFIARPKV